MKLTAFITSLGVLSPLCFAPVPQLLPFLLLLEIGPRDTDILERDNVFTAELFRLIHRTRRSPKLIEGTDGRGSGDHGLCVSQG